MSKPGIVVYSKPRCVKCDWTYKALDKHGIAYEVVNLAEDENALEYVKELGYEQAPVVAVDDEDHWSGFRPDQIERVASLA